jgi:RecA-family ATPase
MMKAVPKCPAGPPGSALWCDHPGQGHREHASAGIVTRALQALTRLCIAANTTIVLIGHNNRAGDFSGSSAWENSARSRIHVKIEKDEETKRESILLAKPKANYAEREDGVMIEWHKGAFRFSDQRFETYGDQLERQMRDRQIDVAFLAGLDKLVERQITTSGSKQAQNYAPKVIVMHAVNGEFTVHELEAAMRRLLAEGRIIGDAQLWLKGNRHWACGLGRKPPADDAPADDAPAADAPADDAQPTGSPA